MDEDGDAGNHLSSDFAADKKEKKMKHNKTMNLNLNLDNDTTIVQWAKNQQLIVDSLAGATQLLLAVHAPVSAATFQFFNCRTINGRSFLVVDYKLECGTGDWLYFSPFVLFMLFSFVLGLPTIIGMYLFINRKHLYSSKIYGRVGFLYEDYNKENFIKLVSKKFKIIDSQSLKDDKRELFFLENNYV